ncbi:serine/threonine-protein phosphatase 2A 56 kDa regulatory subunit delta isoform [Coemansia brasiliensis]|uniref:Serine/threonine-protein phosphatase 2A 56 kDa regulatory subunit delta isoform n=1 Tax=Coemansia brasiliensis TaxID=2650707 RepID=A0A9W8IAV6_9FUNG|nr:serine/threonine-protein phosphatase 2A 56 kDa regulatory subunit delta isoform [Coemansia brasiliensis]
MVRARKSAESFAGSGRLFTAQVDEVPTLRVPRRPQSSRHSFSGRHEFRMLPSLMSEGLSDVERHELLQQKLAQCAVVFDFQSPQDLDGKEAKQRTLNEILEYISDNTGVVTPDLYPSLFKMVSANLFRTIPPQINAFGDLYDPEEDEPREEPSWPHLYLVYHIFLRFLESSDFNQSIARSYIDHQFTMRLLELFDCEDVRERESLKTVLHRIYGKMLNMRSFIRKSINNIFLQFVYETQRHNGIAELLEILGSIINGFTVPLKEEHISFLHRVLLPLHKARPMSLYYAQLSYCTVQFLEKDPTLAETIVKSLLRYWPKVNSPKEVMFVGEIEGIMDVIEPAQFTAVCQPLFQQLVKCIVSPHFQIAERTLGMWRNDYFVNLITDNIRLILPIALSGIYRHSRSHWNRNIHNQVYQILRFFVNLDEKLFEQCLSDFRRQRDYERRRSKKNIAWWSNVERLATERSARDPASPNSSLIASAVPSTMPSSASLLQTSPQPGSAESPSVEAAEDADGAEDSSTSELNAKSSATKASQEEEAEAKETTFIPMSKLDDPETMCCEMDEDEFIQELDKFVDIIKSEDPETAMANGMMLLDESDGSGAVDDMIGSDIQYGYGQPGQFEQHTGQQPHAALLHSMINGGGSGGAHMVMDPSSMQVDYVTGTIMTSEGTLSIASTLAQQSMSSTYEQRYATASETTAGMAVSYADAPEVSMQTDTAAIVSPIPSGLKDTATTSDHGKGNSADKDSIAPPTSTSA